MTAFLAPTTSADPAHEQQLRQDIDLVMQAALEHHRKREFDDATALYATILDAIRDHADANYYLGLLRAQMGRLDEALPHFEIALGRAPDNGQYWAGYVTALVESNQMRAARMALELAEQRGVGGPEIEALSARVASPNTASRTAVTLSTVHKEAASTPQAPPPAGVPINTRRASNTDLTRHAELLSKGKLDASLKIARRLTKQYPSHGECWRALALSLQPMSQYAESVAAAERATHLLPDDLVSHLLLASGLCAIGNWERAEAQCRDALVKFPTYAELHRLLAFSLIPRRRYTESIASCRRAVELAPNSAEMHSTLGVALLEHGQNVVAEVAYRRALELVPMDSAIHSNLLFCMMHKLDLDMATFIAESREFAMRHEEPARAHWSRHANHRDPSRRLRIGLVSGDLIDHPVASFLLPAVEHLARDESLSLYFYSNNAASDRTTTKIRAHAQGWHVVFGMSDAALAQKIRSDGIDILIDLSGHTGRNRLVTFAHKPAPVQASWIGNPATTGMTAIDYYLSDRFVTPLEQFAGKFTEKLVFLPALAPFRAGPDAPPVNVLPALRNGFLTFGSFSRMNKIGPEVVALWARVLREVPGSRLLVGSVSNQDEMSMMAREFASEGIDASRIGFLLRKSMSAYLQQHHEIDVCLDAFPFGGSTTTLQALWMGVPTVTLPGDSMASRSSTAWLTHLGIDTAFVASNKDDYVRKCVALASDIGALAKLRLDLRQRCVESPVFSAKPIADAVSRALRVMWQRWCNGLEPEHFEVSAQPPIAIDTDIAQGPRPGVAETGATTKNYIYQIYYSDETRDQIARGFLPLDNTGQRPDWREYWPMRRFLQENTLDPNSRYGFLSPRFVEKTGVTATEAHAFVSSMPDDIDVVTFSPYFDQAAFFLNVFEHAALCHPGIGPVVDDVLRLIAPDQQASSILMSSVQTVFCNYFVAKPAFWMQWLEKCEEIFAAAEAGKTPFSRKLNADVKYEAQSAPAKVFIIERVASLILATQPEWKVRNFNPSMLPMSNAPVAKFGNELLVLDALKQMAKETGFPQYLEAYMLWRGQLAARLRTGSSAGSPAA